MWLLFLFQMVSNIWFSKAWKLDTLEKEIIGLMIQKSGRKLAENMWLFQIHLDKENYAFSNFWKSKTLEKENSILIRKRYNFPFPNAWKLDLLQDGFFSMEILELTVWKRKILPDQKFTNFYDNVRFSFSKLSILKFPWKKIRPKASPIFKHLEKENYTFF